MFQLTPRQRIAPQRGIDQIVQHHQRIRLSGRFSSTLGLGARRQLASLASAAIIGSFAMTTSAGTWGAAQDSAHNQGLLSSGCPRLARMSIYRVGIEQHLHFVHTAMPACCIRTLRHKSAFTSFPNTDSSWAKTPKAVRADAKPAIRRCEHKQHIRHRQTAVEIGYQLFGFVWASVSPRGSAMQAPNWLTAECTGSARNQYPTHLGTPPPVLAMRLENQTNQKLAPADPDNSAGCECLPMPPSAKQKNFRLETHSNSSCFGLLGPNHEE